ncbi:MAG: DUF6048 family protein [Lutimonas sp.]
MKEGITLRYTISLLLFFFILQGFGQEKEVDSVKLKNRYGLRVGLDLFTPVYGLFDEDRQGFEIVADYRIAKRFWLAGEMGYLDKLVKEDLYNYNTSGGYFKVGADFNAYQNWPGMENMIVVGFRYGISTYSQTLNEYTINSDPYLPYETIDESIDYDGLSAQWFELVLGLKVEVLHNVYLGAMFSGKTVLTATEIDGFKNMFAPGFNGISTNGYGFGFSYTLSYFIPLYRK